MSNLDPASNPGDPASSAADEPPEPVGSPPLDEVWLSSMMLNMKRMTADEAYRLEIARRQS